MRMIPRLYATLLCVQILAAAELTPVAAGIKRKPNIIFLMADQHRWDAIGQIDPTVRTPTLDRLAREGVLFDQAVCQAPMCVPSRYSMMLGLYPHQTGILSNGPGLRDEQLPCDPLPEMLRKAGYQTAGFGKTHWLAEGASTRGFEVRYSSTDSERDAIMMSQQNPDGLLRYHNEVKSFGDGEEWPAGYVGCTSQVSEQDHRDGWAFNRCLEFLDQGLDDKRPLFLYLSFLKPHAGANVPVGYERLYNLADMPVPEQPPLDLVEPCHATGSDRQQMYREFWSKAPPDQWRQMVLRYRANCSWIDSMFGRVMDRLGKKGLLENCLIVYVSDHGEMLGERYYRFNKYCLYESSVRVPLILSGTSIPAGRKGIVDHRLAEEVDIYPTIAAVAGLPVTRAKPGFDLLGMGARKGNFCEYSDLPKGVSFMWRTHAHKVILTFKKDRLASRDLSVSDVISGEYYDLQADPKEWHNLYDQPAHRDARERMSLDLIAHLNEVALKQAVR